MTSAHPRLSRVSIIAAAAAAALVSGAPALAQFNGFIHFGNIKGESAAAAPHGGQIEIESWSWGESRAGYELEPVRVTSWSTSGAGDSASTAGTASRDMRLKGSKIGQNAPDGARGVGASETISVGANRTESPPTMPYNPKELTISKRVPWTSRATPAPSGSLRVKTKMPWLACKVGARYPSLELGGGGKSYLLQGVTVSSCGGSSSAAEIREQVAFTYQTIKFNY